MSKNFTSQWYADYQARSKVSHPKQCERPQELDSSDAREAQGARCIPVCFTLYRVRLLDVDAKYASVKDLLDCLVASKFLDGDKEGQVDLKVNQVKVKHKADERTEIEIGLP